MDASSLLAELLDKYGGKQNGNGHRSNYRRNNYAKNGSPR